MSVLLTIPAVLYKSAAAQTSSGFTHPLHARPSDSVYSHRAWHCQRAITTRSSGKKPNIVIIWGDDI
jgi:hypothetical protein